MTTAVFVYGTLMRGMRNNYLLQGSKFLKVWRTGAKFRLYSNNDAYPCMVPDPQNGCRINGELWKVDSLTLDRLDTLEGHPWLYKREIINRRYSKYSHIEGYLYQQPLDDMKLIGSSWRKYFQQISKI